MNLAPDRLADSLAKGLASLYVVYGDEPLGAIEAADRIRAAARAAGYSERSVHTVQGRYNWNAIFAQGDNFSLFGERRLVEIRIPSGKPGVEGGKALETYANQLPADTLSLVTLPGLDWRSTKSRWFSALASRATVVEARPVERAQLPRWIATRLGRQGLAAEPAALEFLAERVEGNLLAAQQEIDKLALLLPPGKVSLAALENALVDVSRLEAEQLQDALLQGDMARYARVIASLKEGGEHPVAFLWRLADLLRMLLKLDYGVGRGESLAQLMNQSRAREPQRGWIEKTLARLAPQRIEAAQAMLARVDRQAKGLDPTGDAWDTLLQMGLVMTGPARTEHGR